MMRRPAISRADLVVCYRQNPVALEVCADLLGFERQPRVEKPAPPTFEFSAELRPQMKPTPAEPPDLTKKVTFWQHTGTEPHFVHTAGSISPGGPVPGSVGELVRGLKVPPPPMPPVCPPLIPWNKVWPFARAALGTTRPSSRIDVNALVRTLSRGETVRRIPWKPKATWSPQAQLIIDRDRRLVPFWGDQIQFVERLRRWRGGLGLDVVFMPAGPTGPVFRFGRRGVEPYEVPLPEVPVLVLTDLGCLEKEPEASGDWARFGGELRGAGHRPVALVPCPRHQWRPPLDRLWRLACWDQGQALPPLRPGEDRGLRRMSAPDANARQRALERLLGCLAMLVNVEPPLLRGLRLLLGDAAADVAAESAAWRHRDVEGESLTVLGLKKDDPVRAAHRQTFQGEPRQIQEGVLALAHAHHYGDDRRELLLEEFCHFAALGLTPEKVTKTARELFRRVARYLDDDEVWRRDEQDALGVVGWFRRVASRLPPQVRQWDEVSACWRVAEEKLARHGPQGNAEMPEGVDAWPTTPIREHRFTGSWWQVWQRGEAVSVVPAEEDSSEPANRTGAPLAIIRAFSPQFEAIREPGEAEGAAKTTTRFFVRPSAGLQSGCTVGDAGVIVVVSDRQEVRLTPIARGPWVNMGRDRYGLYADFDLAGVVQRMRWIGPGTFMMGSPEDEAERDDDELLHEVTLTKGFWLAETPCTQALWNAVMGKNPSYFKKADDSADRPVEQVSWEDCRDFLAPANRALAGGGLRLPTEGEWEYACRAGTTTPFYFGATISTEQANYDGNYVYGAGSKGVYREETTVVRSFPANAFGLYDMHGNVWEWCADWFGTPPPFPPTGGGRGGARGLGKPAEPTVDPVGPEEGAARVLRGGGWDDGPWFCRSAYRRALLPGFRDRLVGFRLARGQ